jgi:hypothetical protein
MLGAVAGALTGWGKSGIESLVDLAILPFESRPRQGRIRNVFTSHRQRRDGLMRIETELSLRGDRE